MVILAWLAGAATAGTLEVRPPALVTLGEAEFVLADVAVPQGVTIEIADDVQVTAGGLHDRWGRAIATLRDAAGPLNERLIAHGWAILSPDATAESAARLLPLEAAARDARRGFWATGLLRVQNAAGVRGATGDLVLVAGRVFAVGGGGDRLYLNFGEDWRTDFTARIERRAVRAMARNGLDPTTLQGREVRLRGWLRYAGGPLLDIMGPVQIEVLP
jgi:adhesin HecA-like repeat protein